MIGNSFVLLWWDTAFRTDQLRSELGEVYKERQGRALVSSVDVHVPPPTEMICSHLGLVV